MGSGVISNNKNLRKDQMKKSSQTHNSLKGYRSTGGVEIAKTVLDDSRIENDEVKQQRLMSERKKTQNNNENERLDVTMAPRPEEGNMDYIPEKIQDKIVKAPRESIWG